MILVQAVYHRQVAIALSIVVIIVVLADHCRHAHAVHHRPLPPRRFPAIPCHQGAAALSIAVAPRRPLPSRRAVHHRPVAFHCCRSVHCCQIAVVPSIAVKSIAVESLSHSPLPSIAVESPLRIHCCPCHQAVYPLECKGNRKHDARDTFVGGWIE